MRQTCLGGVLSLGADCLVIGTIFAAANFCFWPVLGAACAQTWPQLLVCRVLLGIGMGAKGSTVPIYAAENSPAAIRGALVMSWRAFLSPCLQP